MIVDKKTVYENGSVSIVKVSGYGFRCNTLSSSWDVFYDGKFYQHCIRLKDAKRIAKELITEAA
jgi:hypothetical protein